MKYKRLFVLLVLHMFVCSCFCVASAEVPASAARRTTVLQIHLPREVTIDQDTVKLGHVTIVRGEESLATKVSEVTLGRISVPGQSVVVDRETLLSRLASSSITTSTVKLTGAEKVVVKRQHQTVTGAEFVRIASVFLKKNLSDGSVCRADLIRVPKDLIVPGQCADLKLSPKLASNASRSIIRVRIVAVQGTKPIAVRDVTFRMKYNGHCVVTLTDIPAGGVISPENVKIEKAVSDCPEPEHWQPPYGLIAKRRLPADTVIRPTMIGPVESPVIVERNQNVVIRIERPGLLVTAVGKAMQEARAGEYIKVRNLDSQRIILARVGENGSVEPVF